mmetsp:Transcript_44449/g.113555  ORF Transcript_44449/g.113555 Transcript_44449/m.113555 type:complete len:214 (+) Transcript_44449:801-1442(+)
MPHRCQQATSVEERSPGNQRRAAFLQRSHKISFLPLRILTRTAPSGFSAPIAARLAGRATFGIALKSDSGNCVRLRLPTALWTRQAYQRLCLRGEIMRARSIHRPALISSCRSLSGTVVPTPTCSPARIRPAESQRAWWHRTAKSRVSTVNTLGMILKSTRMRKSKRMRMSWALHLRTFPSERGRCRVACNSCSPSWPSQVSPAGRPSRVPSP